VSVDEPEPLMVVGLNEAVVPGGSPTGPPSCTGPLKVPGLTVTVYVALWPEETVRDEGVALSVNLGAFTTRFTVRCRTMRPLVAGMVSGSVPAGVGADVVTFSVAFAVGVPGPRFSEGGEKLACAPAGSPMTPGSKLTGPWKPKSDCAVIGNAAVAPWVT